MGCGTSSPESKPAPPLQTIRSAKPRERHPEYDYLFKLLLIGDSGVGKSSLMLRFVDDTYSDSFISTIGVDFKIKTLEINGERVKIQIWDTAGQERFRTITSSYYRGAHGIMIVFDIGNLESFRSVAKWINEINKYARDDVVKVVCGNKADLTDVVRVDRDAAEEWCRNVGIEYFEASAKRNEGVESVFVRLVREILENQG